MKVNVTSLTYNKPIAKWENSKHEEKLLYKTKLAMIEYTMYI